MDTLGTRIRLARGKRSQGEFAAQIGVSKGSLGGYERNENLPNTEVAMKICQQTGFSVGWLLTGQGPMRMAADAPLPPPEAAAPPDRKSPIPASALYLKLEEKLEKLEEERRELNIENRRLWKENSDLNARVARLEEQQKKFDPLEILRVIRRLPEAEGH